MRQALNVEWGIGPLPLAMVRRRALAIVVLLGVPAYLWLKAGRNWAGKTPHLPVTGRAPSQRPERPDRSDGTERYDWFEPASAHGVTWRLAHDRSNVAPAVTAKRAAARVADLARVATEGRGRVREASP